MKKLILCALILLVVPTISSAQKTGDLFIENVQSDGTTFSWDVSITPTSDWGIGNRKALGECSFYFNVNINGLNNPVLSENTTIFNSGNGYTISVGTLVFSGQLKVFVTVLLNPNFDGYNLAQNSNEFLFTISMSIIDQNQTANLSWDPLNTGLFNSRGENIEESYFGGSNIPLPVELSDIYYENVKNGIKINWITETEVNNYGFELERKVDGKWNKIAFIEGHGNSNNKKTYSYTDLFPTGGVNLQYRLKQIDFDGSYEYVDSLDAKLDLNLVELKQNYPNPFNPSTNIVFFIPQNEKVKLEVFNVIGQRVSTLIDGNIEAGFHQVKFNGRDLASGVYIYRLATNSFVKIKKMLLVK